MDQAKPKEYRTWEWAIDNDFLTVSAEYGVDPRHIDMLAKGQIGDVRK